MHMLRPLPNVGKEQGLLGLIDIENISVFYCGNPNTFVKGFLQFN